MNPFWQNLVSVLLGGIVATLASLYFNQKAAERTVRRGKLEELCDLLVSLQDEVDSLVSVVRTGRLETAEVLPQIDVSRIHRAYTLIRIYFPSVSVKFVDEIRSMGAYEERPLGSPPRPMEELVLGLERASKSLSGAYVAAIQNARDFH